MGNAYIPRELVHEWSERIGDMPDQATLQRHLKQQRRLGRFIEENAELMSPATRGITMWMIGVICIMFDNAGGRMKQATWAQIREASARVQGVVNDLMPVDDGVAERARAVDWRAQPHILDEALMALFERDFDDEEQEVPMGELLKVYLMMWVATEVLDQNWHPPKGFEGLNDYTYVHIEPEPKAEATSDDA